MEHSKFSIRILSSYSAARNYEPSDTKIGSIRAQMSPDQGPEALLEGSNHNLGYQTVSKFDDLIVESSGSTRRIQRAQQNRNPTSLSQKTSIEPSTIKGFNIDRPFKTTPFFHLFTAHATPENI
ncbi:hypothetical protein M5K25_018588 [Dendrobium thyrsiflorum]|uniref:Uncharacterized protein n=1 Tax=Dendrobium thyrsiflorum TaxID=117978 RepID=A0ABD0UJE6_DENTH